MEREQNTTGTIDWNYWVQFDLWTLRQGTLLLVSFSPDYDFNAFVAGNFPMAIEYRRIRGLAEASVASGMLVPHDPQVLSEPQFVPQEFVAWATNKKITVPNGLHCLLEQGPDPQTATSVSSSEKFDWKKVPDLRWEEIKIRFLSNTAVSITARDHTERKTYIELGFKNAGRRVETPIASWIVLREYFAKKEVRRNYEKKLKDRIKDIRIRFREFFGIKENPFHGYSIGRWEPKFTVEYQTPGEGQDCPPEFVEYDDNLANSESNHHPFDEEDDDAGRFLRDKKI